MLAAACLDYTYIGFDVNAKLLPKLKELVEDIKTIKPNFNYTIYEQGSQYPVFELADKVDFVFTSPPYFNLEKYGNNDKEEKDSYRNTTYQEWLDLFVKPLINNCYHYIKPNGLVAFNVKDFTKKSETYTLVKDFTETAINTGLKIDDYLTMKNNTRVGSVGTGEVGVRGAMKIDNDEGVYIFSK